MKGKNIFLQTIRGICIILVILIHCRYVTEKRYEWHNYSLILRQFINFPVAVFIFLSGYFTDVSKEYSVDVMLKRLRRLIIPYIVWSIIYTIIDWVASGEYSIILLIKNLFLGTASGQMYFILVMVQLTMLVPAIKYMLNKNGGGYCFLLLLHTTS